MADEYSSDVNMFIKNGNYEPTQIPEMQPPPQMQPPQMQQAPMQQMPPMYNNTPMMMPPTNMGNDQFHFKPMEYFGFNFNAKENILSILVIVILFMLFASQNFKKLLAGLPFTGMINGEYNITTLFVIGLAFAIIYNVIKMFAF